MRLIDADACEPYFYEHLDDAGMVGALNAIAEMPAVELVRCGECVNWDRTWNNDNWSADFERHYCPMVDLVTSAIWYCFDGERSEDDEARSI